MAKSAPHCLFLVLVTLSSSSGGTRVGIPYDAAVVTVSVVATRPDTAFPRHSAATPMTVPLTRSYSAREDEHMLLPMALPRRELASEVKSSVRDSITPPTTIVTAPATPMSPATAAPTTPTNPAATFVPVANPVATPPTVTTPTAPAVTNPVTTYPAPPAGAGYAPVVANAPATPGQSWCVARSGASESALQSALDYACGIGGADCSQIQLGAGCYSPNTLQNHASFAFNSYYQRNPVASSCDFGGTAYIVATNPSTGSCLYATYSSSSQPVQTPSTAATNPATTTTTGPPAAAAASSSYGSPPSFLNSSTNPPSATTTQVFGSQTPPLNPDISPSNSAAVRPLTGSIVPATLFAITVTILGCLTSQSLFKV